MSYFPAIIAKPEQSEFTCINFAAFDLLRKENDNVQPCWLCLNEEAKENARQAFYRWYNNNVRPLVPVRDNDDFRLRQLENELKNAIGPMLRIWIEFEAEMKAQRRQGNPQAFFTPTGI